MTHSLTTQFHIAPKVIDLSKPFVFKIKNRPYFPKPSGAFWTATFLGHARISAWYEWCKWEMPHWIHGETMSYLVSVNKDALIYTIDSYSDLVSLYKQYGSKGQYGAQLDFETISQRYDGLRLTENGEAATRYVTDKSADGMNLYGWDVESTAFFRQVFTLEQYEYRKATFARGKIKGRGR